MNFFGWLKRVEGYQIGVDDPVNAVRAFSKNDTYSNFQEAAKKMATALQAFPEANPCCQNVLTLIALLVGELLQSHLRALAKKRRDQWFHGAVDWRGEWIKDGSSGEIFFDVKSFKIDDLLNFPQILQQVTQAGKTIKQESLVQMQVLSMFTTVLFESLCGLPEQYIAMSTDYLSFRIDLATLENKLVQHFKNADSLRQMDAFTAFRCKADFGTSSFASEGNGSICACTYFSLKIPCQFCLHRLCLVCGVSAKDTFVELLRESLAPEEVVKVSLCSP